MNPVQVLIQRILSHISADLQILQHRQIRKYPASLRHQRDAFGDDLVRRQTGQLRILEPNAAALRLHQTNDGTQGRAFSCTIGADQRHHLAFGHLKTDLLDCFDPSIGYIQILYFQNITHPAHLPDKLR